MGLSILLVVATQGFGAKRDVVERTVEDRTPLYDKTDPIFYPETIDGCFMSFQDIRYQECCALCAEGHVLLFDQATSTLDMNYDAEWKLESLVYDAVTSERETVMASGLGDSGSQERGYDTIEVVQLVKKAIRMAQHTTLTTRWRSTPCGRCIPEQDCYERSVYPSPWVDPYHHICMPYGEVTTW